MRRAIYPLESDYDTIEEYMEAITSFEDYESLREEEYRDRRIE